MLGLLLRKCLKELILKVVQENHYTLLRIAIARVIVKQLKILLLDEASSVLDKSEVLVQQVLDCASKNRFTINLIKNWCRLKGILLQLSAFYVVLIVENKDDWR